MITAILIVLVFTASCDSGHSPNPIPQPSYSSPVFQSYPACLTEDLVFFENYEPEILGGEPQGSGFPVSQVLSYSIQSGEFSEIAPEGVQLSNQPSLGSVVWLSSFDSGAVIICDLEGTIVVDEPWTWAWRRDVCLSPSGVQLAWQSKSDERERGIWIYNMESREYSFVAEGSFPVWHPDSDTLYYSGYFDGQGPYLQKYIPQSSFPGIIARYPFGNYGEYLAFSPDGSKLAFSQFEGESHDGIWTYNIEEEEFTHRIGEPDLEYPVRGISWGPSCLVVGTVCRSEELPGCGRLWEVSADTWEMSLLWETEDDEAE